MKFTKMHGIGNDFVVMDVTVEPISEHELSPLAVRLNDRRFGIGGDGLVLILPSDVGIFRMRMINPDGSEAGMCGNGIRCFGKYLYDHGLTSERSFLVETKAGPLALQLQVEGNTVSSVTVDMGTPRLTRADIPMTGSSGEQCIEQPLRVDGREFRITAVSMGNPHVVAFVEDLCELDVAHWGPLIERHDWFPDRTNVQFARVSATNEIELRTWERGAGMTMACGTGACAALAAAAITGRSMRAATVHLLGGDLQIDWRSDNHIFMTGPAEEVFSGEIEEPLVPVDTH